MKEGKRGRFWESFTNFDDPIFCYIVVVGGDYTKKMNDVHDVVEYDMQPGHGKHIQYGNGFGLMPESIFVFLGPDPGLAGDVKRNKKIGTIDTLWGARFRVTLDLIIHSHIKRKWASVFSVVWGTYRLPSIQLHRNGFLRIINAVNGNKNHRFIYKVELGRWYNIRIEQVDENWMKKVNEGVLREGK